MEVDPARVLGRAGGQTDRQTEGRLIDQTASLLLIYSDRKSITCLPLISPPLVFPAAPPSPLFSLAASAPVTHLCKCEGWGGSGGGRGWGVPCRGSPVEFTIAAVSPRFHCVREPFRRNRLVIGNERNPAFPTMQSQRVAGVTGGRRLTVLHFKGQRQRNLL